jgi:hypothetical protein
LPRYYVAVLYALSTILVRKRRSPRGYEAVDNYIPGSTLGGAIARILGLAGLNALSRGFSVSDAYPVREII